METPPTPKDPKKRSPITIALIVLGALLLAFIVIFLMADPCPPGEPVPANQPAPAPGPVLESKGTTGTTEDPAKSDLGGHAGTK